MIEIEAPNGDIVEFPDDTPDAVIDRVMRQNYGQANPDTAPAQPVRPERSAAFNAGAFSNTASGLNRGLLDVATGVIEAPGDLLYGATNALFGYDPRTSKNPVGDTAQRGLERVGLANEGDAQTASGRFGRDVGQGLGAVFATAGTGAALPAASRVGQLARDVAGRATNSLGSLFGTMAGEAAAVTGSRAGGAVGDMVGGGVGETIGSVAGALTPALAAAGIGAGARKATRGGNAANVVTAADELGVPLSAGLVGNSMVARTEEGVSNLMGVGTPSLLKRKSQDEAFEAAVPQAAALRRGNAVAEPVEKTNIGTDISDLSEQGLDRIKAELATKETALGQSIAKLDSAVGIGDIEAATRRLIRGTTPEKGSALGQKLSELQEMRNKPIDRALHQTLKSRERNVQSRMSALKDGAPRAARKAINEELSKVQREIQANLGVDYARLRQWRSEVGEATRDMGISGGLADQVYAPTTRALEDIATKAGVGEDFSTLMKREAELYKRKGSLELGGDIGAMRQLVDARDADAVFKRVAPGGVPKFEQLDVLRRNVAPADFARVSGDILEQMGHATASRGSATFEFSPETFLTHWNKADARTKALLAGPDPEVRKKLDALATVASAFRDRGKVGNPSGTGALLGNTSLLVGTGALASNPALLAASLTPPLVVSTLTSSEGFARWIAKETPSLAEILGPRLVGQAGREALPE